MKLNAVAVSSSDFQETVRFYSLLGFKFPDFELDAPHLEAITEPGSTRLMIDTQELITDIIGQPPHPANHSGFAIEYESAGEVNAVADNIRGQGFNIVREPWDAPWGQRYCIVKDPDGYMIDLYAAIK